MKTKTIARDPFETRANLRPWWRRIQTAMTWRDWLILACFVLVVVFLLYIPVD